MHRTWFSRFAVVAIGSLALSIGANTSIFPSSMPICQSVCQCARTNRALEAWRHE